jgi:V/A-type H+/Na+-transporting ATPase subunit A
VTEPVTAHTRRFVRNLWSLDRDLAYARHYPAVTWRDSFSRDAESLAVWHAENGDPDWAVRRGQLLGLLAEADRLEPVVQLVGAGTLPDRERLVLVSARLLREGVLQQSAMNENDAHCLPAKQAALLAMVLGLHDRAQATLERGVHVSVIEQLDLSPAVRARQEGPPDDVDTAARVLDTLCVLLDGL